MHPPVDPWESHDPTRPEPLPPRAPSAPMYGRAAVPVPSQDRLENTAELPVVAPASMSRGVSARGVSARGVSWQRTSRASIRRLSDGWGFTAAGVMVAFSGWGVWAAALRGTGSSPFAGLVFMIVVAAGLFTLARFLGYLVVQQVLRRPRLHARWAHFLTGLFLTAAGISYLANTTWIAEAGDWLRAGIDWVGQLWP